MTQKDHAASASSDLILDEEERLNLLKRTEAEIEQIKAEQAAEMGREPDQIHWAKKHGNVYGIILLAGNFLILGAGLGFGLQLSEWGQRINPMSAGGDSPLYDIQRDFLSGLAMVIPFLLAMTMAGVFYRRSPLFSLMAFWMSVLFMAREILNSMIIYFNTTGLLTPGFSAPAWPTVMAYNSDPQFQITQGIVFVLATSILLLRAVFSYFEIAGFEREKEGTGAQPLPPGA